MRVAKLWERFHGSLFYIPLLFGVAAAVLAEVALLADANIDGLPNRLTATVDSARSVLGVIASATLAFAGIAFSVSLLLISAAASQFSPRVVHGLFRDPFNKRVMGLVVGTFVYCLVVMQATRGPLEGSGVGVVPSLSVTIALALGLATILAIVGFINHSAHSMEVSTMLHNVTEAALVRVREIAPDQWESDAEFTPPDGPELVVTFAEQGWVQIVDHRALMRALPPHSTMQLETRAGRYAIGATPLCRIWPQPAEPELAIRGVRQAVTIGPSRSTQQDASFGVRQLADVALKALSPGINDPTTAQDALFHMGSVLRELLALPHHGRFQVGEEDRLLLVPENQTPEEIIGLAFDEVRLASVGQPAVLIYLLQILHVLHGSLDQEAHPKAIAALRSQAAHVRAGADFGDLPEHDRQRVREAHDRRFGEV